MIPHKNAITTKETASLLRGVEENFTGIQVLKFWCIHGLIYLPFSHFISASQAMRSAYKLDRNGIIMNGNHLPM